MAAAPAVGQAAERTVVVRVVATAVDMESGAVARGEGAMVGVEMGEAQVVAQAPEAAMVAVVKVTAETAAMSVGQAKKVVARFAAGQSGLV